MRHADVNGRTLPFSPELPMMDEMLDHPAARFALTVFTAATTISLLPLIYLLNLPIPEEFLKWSIVLLAGFTAGTASHFLMRSSSIGLQFAAAFSAILVDSFLLGWLTMGRIGFGWGQSLEIYATLRWASELILACLAAALTMRGWNTSIPKIRIPSRARKSNKLPAVKPASKTTSPASKHTRKQAKTPVTASTKSKASASSRRRSAPREIVVIPNAQRQKSVQGSSTPRLKSLENRIRRLWERARVRKNQGDSKGTNLKAGGFIKPRKPQPQPAAHVESGTIKLLGKVEHRCPYCLEIVQKNDPRGVKTCPICQTQHHLDCWNITGICQVPHQSESL